MEIFVRTNARYKLLTLESNDSKYAITLYIIHELSTLLLFANYHSQLIVTTWLLRVNVLLQYSTILC